jgi:hypothetical protein
MNASFYRFPHTPHLAWLASGPVRDDKVFTPQEAKAFLSQPVAIEEKIDGANIGFSLSPKGSLRIQQRGNYLQPPYNSQFSGLTTWLALHGPDLESFLQEPEHQGLILFGEWCSMSPIQRDNASGAARGEMSLQRSWVWSPFPSSRTTVATPSTDCAARSITFTAAFIQAPRRE